jgi:lipid A ethanolaminephosphotransferase
MAVLEQLLATADPGKPLFVYVVLFGVHSPYQDKYPASATRFPEDPGGTSGLSDAERLINGYKNGVGWSVDTFFKGLFKDARRFPNTVVLYTSDHGEDLSSAVHCTVQNPDLHEGLVPLLAVTDHPTWGPKLAEAALRNKDRASHFNLIPTVLEIFGFETRGINEWHGLTLFQDIEQPRKFLSRGIRINVAGVGLESKVLWQTLPSDWVSDAPHP